MVGRKISAEGIDKEDGMYIIFPSSFDLFVDFKGYVDYFFFQDCVTDDYSSVIFWYGNGSFQENKRPQSAADYKLWIERELDFLDKRNERIKNSLL